MTETLKDYIFCLVLSRHIGVIFYFLGDAYLEFSHLAIPLIVLIIYLHSSWILYEDNSKYPRN